MNKIDMKFLVFSAVLVISSIVSKAQTISAGPKARQFFVKGNVGYGFGMNKQYMGSKSSSNFNDNSITNEGIYASFGSGFCFGVGGGYMFNDYLGVEIMAKYHSYFLQEFEGNSFSPMSMFSNSRSFSTGVVKNSGNQLNILPSLVFKAPLGKVSPYAKLGIALPVWTSYKTIQKVPLYFSNENGTIETSLNREYETSFSFGLGAQGTLGAFIDISDKISLFVELNYLGLSLNTKKSKLTKSEYDGVDEMSSLSVYDKETIYETSYSYPGYSSGFVLRNDAEPRKSLATSTPFSSLGLNIGLVFAFGGK